MKLPTRKVTSMEVKADVKARGLYELRQIQELMTQLVIGASEHNALIREQIQTRIIELEQLINELRQMTGDDEAQEMVSDFESLRRHSQKVLVSQDSLSKLVMEDLQNCQPVEQEMFNADNQTEVIRTKPRRKTVIGDFAWSLAYTLGICIFFAIIWTQYARTH